MAAVTSVLLFGSIPALAASTSLELYVPEQNQETVHGPVNTQGEAVKGTEAPKTGDLLEKAVPVLGLLILGTAGAFMCQVVCASGEKSKN